MQHPRACQCCSDVDHAAPSGLPVSQRRGPCSTLGPASVAATWTMQHPRACQCCSARGASPPCEGFESDACRTWQNFGLLLRTTPPEVLSNTPQVYYRAPPRPPSETPQVCRTVPAPLPFGRRERAACMALANPILCEQEGPVTCHRCGKVGHEKRRCPSQAARAPAARGSHKAVPVGADKDDGEGAFRPSADGAAASAAHGEAAGEALRLQVEYYFGDANLPTDKFLLKEIRSNADGWVRLETILTFRRMQRMRTNLRDAAAALRASSMVAVHPDGDRVRRVAPMPEGTWADADVPEEEDALSNKRYKLMHTSVLREYLAAEMFVPDLPFQLSVERLFDDFVFMSFFAGNDFLPHMPTLEIREGALDLLLTLYRGLLPAMGGPLCSGSEANLERVEMLMRAVAEHEDAIFEKRRHFEESSRREALRKCRAASHAARARRRAAASTLQAGAGTKGEGEDSEPCPGGSTLGQVAFGACDDAPIPLEPGEVAMVADVAVEEGALSEQAPDRGMAAEEELKMRLAENMEEKSQALYENCKDEVMLGQDGWKERYYSSKLSWSGDELCESKNQMVYKYVEGLCWVLKYYLEGCPSWGWYYPYHYAPFASDFEGCSKFEIQFEMGQPFQPLSQLMAVLPAASSQALPAPYAALMTDPGSPIAHFYPKDFELDLNGKRFAWQAVALLPFIDADQLLEAIARIEGALGVDEAQRNTQHSERLFISSSHALAPSLHVLCSEAQSSSEREGAPGMRAIDPLLSSSAPLTPWPLE
ncbi:hypothetical protein CYMTET_36647 [Cymbomonas tetramitiformis]|uniref:Uncharacterized protein n=1 Tax=Cymbomonas tetramitiformis TaxID=36881 RepID=A0AAE0CFH7_9CHLO|nr:hypothetical protein CYMTET_36647 [Cymbomonas tetramitiformis]